MPQYRSKKQEAEKEIERLQTAKQPVSTAKKKLAVITRNMESVELAAQFINLTRKPG